LHPPRGTLPAPHRPARTRYPPCYLLLAPANVGTGLATEDLAGLRHLANHLGSRFVAGYLLYTCQQALSFGEGLRALSIDALWRAAP
jgi:hypothetical protein